MRDAIRQLYKDKGIKIFYSGMSACLVRTYPVDAITIASFEFINEWLESKNLQ